MNAKKTLRDTKIHVKLKLAMLWTSFMFFYVYVDHFALYMPNKIEGILKGKVFIFDISQVFLFIALLFMAIPALMIFLSVILPAKINRLVNVIIATLFIPYMLFNLAGEVWTHMVFAAVVEVAILGLIILYSFNWPHLEAEK